LLRATRTVDNHLNSAYRKLGIKKRAQLLRALADYDAALGDARNADSGLEPGQ